MQTQDLKYIKFKHQLERKKIDKIQKSSHLIDSDFRPAKSHIFFVDSAKQRSFCFCRFQCVVFVFDLVEKFDPVKQMRTHPALINRRSNRLTIDQLKSTKFDLNEQQINVKLTTNKRTNENFSFVFFRNFKNFEKRNTSNYKNESNEKNNWKKSKQRWKINFCSKSDENRIESNRKQVFFRFRTSKTMTTKRFGPMTKRKKVKKRKNRKFFREKNKKKRFFFFVFRFSFLFCFSDEFNRF